jgi:hypothetical protein
VTSKTLFQLLALTLLLAVLATSCGSPVYFLKPIDAVVIDGKTRKPLSGVHVIANWELVRGGPDGAHFAGQLGLKEAVTDDRGRFHIDGFIGINPLLKELREAGPRLSFFKPGYDGQSFSNTHPRAGKGMPGLLRASRLNGETIFLFSLDLPEKEKSSLSFYTGLGTEMERVLENNCNWRKLPYALRAMDAEAKRLREQFPNALIALPSLEKVDRLAAPWCGSAQKYFRGKQ